MILLIIFLHIEIDAALADIGVAVVEDLFHQLLLLDDMAAGEGLDAGRQNIQGVHGLVEAVGIELRHLHGLQLFEAGFLGNLVLALIGVVLQMTHVGDIAHIAHLVTDVLEIAEKDVESDGGAGVTQMGIAINGGAAHIHPHPTLVDGAELLFLT